MRFENQFEVDAPQPEVWEALMDIERVTPCLPGAKVAEKKSETAYEVSIKVKLGPVAMNYLADVEITDRDDEAHTARMLVKAHETRGQGNAEAEVTMSTSAEGEKTRAEVATELKMSGRAASMGQSMITDVSTMLVNRFALNLAKILEGGDDAAAEADANQPAAAGDGGGSSGGEQAKSAKSVDLDDEVEGLPIGSLLASSLLKQAQENAGQISLLALFVALVALMRSRR